MWGQGELGCAGPAGQEWKLVPGAGASQVQQMHLPSLQRETLSLPSRPHQPHGELSSGGGRQPAPQLFPRRPGRSACTDCTRVPGFPAAPCARPAEAQWLLCWTCGSRAAAGLKPRAGKEGARQSSVCGHGVLDPQWQKLQNFSPGAQGGEGTLATREGHNTHLSLVI